MLTPRERFVEFVALRTLTMDLPPVMRERLVTEALQVPEGALQAEPADGGVPASHRPMDAAEEFVQARLAGRAGPYWLVAPALSGEEFEEDERPSIPAAIEDLRDAVTALEDRQWLPQDTQGGYQIRCPECGAHGPSASPYHAPEPHAPTCKYRKVIDRLRGVLTKEGKPVR